MSWPEAIVILTTQAQVKVSNAILELPVKVLVVTLPVLLHEARNRRVFGRAEAAGIVRAGIVKFS